MLRSLHAQVLAGQLILAVLLTLVLGISFYQVAAKILERKEWEQVHLLSQGLARETHQAIVRCEAQLDRMGSGQELERFADSHNFHILQALFDKSKDFFTSIAYITPQGVQEYAALGPGYSDRDTDLGTDPLVADCLNAPNRIVSAVRLSRINGPQLVLALSKRSPFGTNMGALLAAIPLSRLAQSALDLHMEHGGYAVLADASGRLLTMTDADGQPPQLSAGSHLAEALAEGRNGVVRETFFRQDSLIGLSGIGRHGLATLVVQPRRTAIGSELDGLRSLTVGIALLASALAGLAALWLSNGLTRPIRQLAAAAQTVSAGDLAVQAPVTGPRETRELARSFNTMTTALARSRERMERDRDNLEHILAAMNEALVVVNRQGRVVMLNRAGQDLLGYSQEEIATRPVEELLVPDDPLADFMVSEDTWRLLDHSGLTGLEKTLVSKSGRETPVLVSLALLRGQAGTLEGVVCLAMDITERKRAEALTRARRAAEAASRAKTEFLAVLSHEMRTPLNIVLGILEHLLESSTALSTRQALELALRSGRSLLDVIVAMLDYAGLEAGRVLLRRQAFDPRHLAAAVAERHLTAAKDKGLHLNLTVAPEVPSRLIGDPDRLGQALSNLLANAVRFTALGEIQLALLNITPGNDTTRCRLLAVISDTGMGITDAKLEYVFEPFTQEDATSTRRFGGLGLGLAITRRLVLLMGGSLCLDSQAGEGTDAYLGLTLEQEAVRESEAFDI